MKERRGVKCSHEFRAVLVGVYRLFTGVDLRKRPGDLKETYCLYFIWKQGQPRELPLAVLAETPAKAAARACRLTLTLSLENDEAALHEYDSKQTVVDWLTAVHHTQNQGTKR